MDKEKIIFPRKKALVSISAEGITIFEDNNKSYMTIPWVNVMKAGWRSVYNNDAYHISTAESDIELTHSDPIESRKHAHRYWLVSLFAPRVVSSAYATATAYKNIEDIDDLAPIHLYALYYSKRVTSRWSNYFEKFLFTQFIYFSLIVMIATWFYGITRGYRFDSPEMDMIIAIFAMVLGFGSIIYRIVNELKFSQKLV